MLVKIEELEEGDEILVPSNGELGYLRILRKPSKNKLGRWRYVVCSIRSDKIILSNAAGKSWESNQRICTAEDHNKTVSRNLVSRPMWLVNKQGN